MQELISKKLIKNQGLEPIYPKAYDFKSPSNLTDIYDFMKGQPWDTYDALRTNAPVYWHPVVEDNSGFWTVTKYDLIKAVSRKPEIFSSERGGILQVTPSEDNRDHILTAASNNNMIQMDGDWHDKLRAEHAPFFTVDNVKALQNKVSARIDFLLDEVENLDSFDMVEKFSSQLPLYTLSEILGIPLEDQHLLVKWMHYLELASAAMRGELLPGMEDPEKIPAMIEEFEQNFNEMFEYGRRLLKGRRNQKQPDLLNAIAWAELEGSVLNDQYLDGSWLLIVFAGNDTTRNSLSGGMKLLTENPEQKQKVLANKELLTGMTEEILRMVSPVMYMSRMASEDTELGGQKIAKDERVIMYYGAANRDPEVFENPHQFNVERANASRHLAFGFGKHVCLGNRVARMQLTKAYEKIFERYPTLHFTGEMEIAPNNFVHAISKLMVAK